jgi:uncharacterized coiled-coil DUF342 family protein
MPKRERNINEIRDGAREGAERAEKLHAKADDLHRRTDEVHMKAKEVHAQITAIRERATSTRKKTQASAISARNNLLYGSVSGSVMTVPPLKNWE